MGYTGSSEDDSDVALNFRYSSEDSICGDEGIEPDEYKRHTSKTGYSFSAFMFFFVYDNIGLHHNFTAGAW